MDWHTHGQTVQGFLLPISALCFTSHHTTLLTLHNRLPCLSVPFLCNAPCCKHSSFSITGTKGCSYYSEYRHNNNTIQYPPQIGAKLQLLWFVSPSLTYDEAKLCLILRHGNYPRNPPACTRGSPRTPRTNIRTSVSGFLPQQVG